MTTVTEKFGCSACNMKFYNLKIWEMHIAGKKHQYNQHRAEVIRKREENGLFISGFPNNAHSESLRVFFRRFGEMIDFYYNVDKRFVLTTFKEKSVADDLLHNEKGVWYSGRRLKIHRRRPCNSPTLQQVQQQQSGALSAPSITTPNKKPTLPGVDHERVTALLNSGSTLQDLLCELQVSPEEKAMYDQVFSDLKKLFEIQFPKCNIHPFGSTRTGLNLKGSDIDMYVEILQPEQSCRKGISALPQPEKLVRIGQKLMIQNTNIFRHVQAITRAKTPIVKFIHWPTKISCDVSFKNMLGVANSKLIQLYLKLDPRVYPYFMIIKYWARIHEFSGCGRMSNYALVTIAAYYLQQLDPPVLPTVSQLQNLCTEEKFVDGWLCSFSEDPSAVETSKNTASVFELLEGFFKFYRDFNIQGLVLCTLTASTLTKVQFLNPDNLPDFMKERYAAQDGKFGLRISTDMVVQDPFELTHNLTASMGSRALKAFLSHCELAATIFEKALKQPEEKRLPFLNDLFNKKPSEKVNAKSAYSCLSNAEMTMTYLAEETLSVGYLITSPTEPPNSEMTPMVILERWVSLVYKLVIEFFDRIMKFHVREEPNEQIAAKIQKVDSPSDVHVPVSGILFSEKRVLHCRGSYCLWEGRKKVQKGLRVPSNIDCLTIEEMVSEAMYVACVHKGVPSKPIVSFRCEFQPIKEPASIRFVFKDTGCQNKSFMNGMMFFRTRLPTLLDKYMKFLKHQTRTSTYDQKEETPEDKNATSNTSTTEA